MRNVSLKVLEVFVQKRVRTLFLVIICFLFRATHIFRDLCFLARGTPITSDVWFLCRGTHNYHQGFLYSG